MMQHRNSPDGEKNQESQQKPEQKMDKLIELGSSVVKNRHGTIHCLTIIGQIEGHTNAPENAKTTKYEHLLPLLASLEESDDVDGVLILLNTVGGDVEAGLALAEMIAGMTKPTATLVLGGGHSIGIPLAVSGKINMIAPSASMTVHPVRMTGTMIAAPQTYRYFDKLQESIVRFVAAHSQIRAETFRELMLRTDEMANDVGSVLYGEDAVALGLMQQVGTLKDALGALYQAIDQEKKQGNKDLILPTIKRRTGAEPVRRRSACYCKSRRISSGRGAMTSSISPVTGCLRCTE